MDISLNKYHASSADEMMAIGSRISEKAQPGMVIAMSGGLGAGKTTLVKGIAEGLGICESVTSPSFTIINEYADGRIPLYHMDFYRISSSEELEFIGAEELFYGDGLSVIEWKDNAEDIIPVNAVLINIEINEDNSRNVVLQGLYI